MALEGVTLENFGDPYVPLESSYFYLQDEWRHDIYIY